MPSVADASPWRHSAPADILLTMLVMKRTAPMVVVLATLLGLSSAAHADSASVKAETGRTDRQRLWHGLAFVGGGALYLGSEFLAKDSLTSDHCRWCTPGGLDTRVRNQLVWDDGLAADRYSNYTGYIASPLFAVGALLLSTSDDLKWRRWFDDTMPVLESAVIASVLNQVTKIAAARQRPYAYFGGTAVQAEGDANLSFFSGHTVLGFTLAASAGTVASLRGYRSAPYIWGGGMALALATSYLRMAADAHYFTDVLVGALVGTGIGIAVPLLLHGDVLRHRGDAPSSSAITAAPVGPSGGLGFSIGGDF